MSNYENLAYLGSFLGTFAASTAFLGFAFIGIFETRLIRMGRSRPQVVNICYGASALLVLATMTGLITFLR